MTDVSFFPMGESQDYILGLFPFIVKKTASLMERIVRKEVLLDVVLGACLLTLILYTIVTVIENRKGK